MGLGTITPEKIAFVLVDLQDKFVPVIHEADKIIANINILLKAAQILHIPLIVTEQYPEGLGKTSANILLPENKQMVEKIEFSCFDCETFLNKIDELGIETILLFGVEAHVCILKTALDAVKSGIEVHVVADAVSSRTPENRQLALDRMRQSGVYIASTEMIIFQLIEKAGTDEFRSLSELIK